jgi:hypothetical protein
MAAGMASNDIKVRGFEFKRFTEQAEQGIIGLARLRWRFYFYLPDPVLNTGYFVPCCPGRYPDCNQHTSQSPSGFILVPVWDIINTRGYL